MAVNFRNTQKQELYKDFNRSVTNPFLKQVKNKTKLPNAYSSIMMKCRQFML